jgi:acyl-CoA reductase-like NAD-dependent aldehyde dehydrogenase
VGEGFGQNPHENHQSCTFCLTQATQEVVNTVPEASESEFNTAVEGSVKAFAEWKKTPVLTRQRYMFDYLKLLKENHNKLADIITRGIIQLH